MLPLLSDFSWHLFFVSKPKQSAAAGEELVIYARLVLQLDWGLGLIDRLRDCKSPYPTTEQNCLELEEAQLSVEWEQGEGADLSSTGQWRLL